MPIYLPKQIVDVSPGTESPLLFLAGPIRGGGDWQAEMSNRILEKAPLANIACPSRWDSLHPLASHFHRPFSDAGNRQLVWERHYLKMAGLDPGLCGCVIFWLGCEDVDRPHPGPEPYAMDTRREIGKFTAYAEMKNVRMVIGGDRAFHGLDVILFELAQAYGRQILFHGDMGEVVEDALNTARNSYL